MSPKQKQQASTKPEPQPAVKPEQPTAPATPAPTAEPQTAVAQTLGNAKQVATLELLKAAWTKRGDVDLSKLSIAADGKFLNVQVADNWPLIVVGNGAGSTFRH